ncbi:MAG: hypothetical protein WA738_18240 [Candidatus Angelobacter sp.]
MAPFKKNSAGLMTPPATDEAPQSSSSHVTAPAIRSLIRDNKDVLLYVLALAIITGTLYFWHFHNHYFPDSPSYITPAAHLLSGHGFTDSNGYPATIPTPGYPLLILPFLWAHLNLTFLVLFQHALRVLLVLASTVFVLRFAGDTRKALLTGVLLCLDFLLLEAANAVLTEMLFTVIICAILWLLWSESGKTSKPGLMCLAAGLLTGAAVLVRPVAILFFVPAALYLLMTRQRYRIRAATGFVLVSLCLPLLWATRNYHETGNFTLSSIAGYNALFYRGAGALAANDPGDFRQNFPRRQQELDVQACHDLEREYRQECSAIPFAQKAGYYSRRGREIVWHNPIGYAKACARGALVMLLDGGPTSLAGIAGTTWPVGMRVLMVYTLPLLGLALFGLVAFWNTSRNFFWLALLTWGYFVGISAGPEAYGRFRVPFLPLYIILAVTGLEWALKRIRGAFNVAPRLG